ncbi:MAG: PHP domain-containing protein [Acidobacteriia bacterium]|nr:PHP domain-containing protein [Terriglobia bacterium]
MARTRELASLRHLESDAELGSLFETPPPDIDPEILKRLRQMYETGGWVLVESTIADLPADLRWLFESGAVTLEQLASIHKALGITSNADLAAAVGERTLQELPGIGVGVEAAISAALPALRALVPRIPLGRATALAEPFLERLRALSGVVWAHAAGSLRRGQDMVGDIEIVAAADQPRDVIEEALRVVEAPRCLHRSERRLYLLDERVQVGLRVPEPANAGATLLYLTGSVRHFDALRARAAATGWLLTPGGLYTSDGTLRPAASEDEIYAAIGLQPVPPEIRNGDDEIAAAARGELPALVSVQDIRGDLHMHSTYSDGRDSIEAMVQECRTLGYQYLAITDHSPHSAATRTLTVEGVGKQAEDIQQLRERYPDITILHGCEVDILPDGRLDFPDKVLERFDLALASLHEGMGHSPDQLMKRYASAMKHPLVTMITHPTNRLVPHRPGYDLDYDRLFAMAVETRTLVEVDGAPAHLDMDGELARRAVAAGLTIAISSDSHRATLLRRQMQLGVLTARRGWVEPRHVVNTRSIEDVRTILAAKRAAR